jgi:hypothetical protein
VRCEKWKKPLNKIDGRLKVEHTSLPTTNLFLEIGNGLIRGGVYSGELLFGSQVVLNNALINHNSTFITSVKY